MKRSIFIIIFAILLAGCQKSEQKSSQTEPPSYLVQTDVSIPIDHGQHRLYGTLTLPKGIKNPPVVLIIAGSGPTDRDGNQPKMKSNIYKILADSLAKHGIASLRYDKRGVGQSKIENLDETQLRFEMYADDAAAWIHWLKNQHHFSKIAVLGHSEGSLLGILAIEKEPADLFISVAGPGRPIDVILKEQLAEQSESLAKQAAPIIDSLKAGYKVNNVPKKLRVLFRPSIQPYLMSWMKYDPAREIAKLDIPVLIIQGTTDLQVKPEDAKILADNAKNGKLVIIEGMNHVFRKAPKSKLKNILTYTNPKLPIMGEFVEAIVNFVKNTKVPDKE